MNTAFALLLALQAASTAESAAPAALPAPLPSCETSGYQGFDFWVGEWDVFANGQDVKVADSRIERSHGGCAVIENWMPLKGGSGTSLSHYDADSGQWHQKWIGSSPGAVEFSGGVTDGKMVLTGNWPNRASPHSLVRMTYSQLDDGSVRQFGQVSTDHGLSWQVSFDFIYRAKKDAP